MDSPEMDDDDMELHSPREEDDNEQEDSAPEDDDLNFKKNENEPKKKDQKPQKEIKTQPVKDKEYDEVFEVSDHGSEYASENEQQDEEDERPKDDSADEPPSKPAQKPQPQANQYQEDLRLCLGLNTPRWRLPEPESILRCTETPQR